MGQGHGAGSKRLKLRDVGEAEAAHIERHMHTEEHKRQSRGARPSTGGGAAGHLLASRAATHARHLRRRRHKCLSDLVVRKQTVKTASHVASTESLLPQLRRQQSWRRPASGGHVRPPRYAWLL